MEAVDLIENECLFRFRMFVFLSGICWYKTRIRNKIFIVTSKIRCSKFLHQIGIDCPKSSEKCRMISWFLDIILFLPEPAKHYKVKESSRIFLFYFFVLLTNLCLWNNNYISVEESVCEKYHCCAQRVHYQEMTKITKEYCILLPHGFHNFLSL